MRYSIESKNYPEEIDRAGKELNDGLSALEFGERYFSHHFYEASYKDVGHGDLKRHWLLHGVLEGRTPHPLVDPDFYSANNPDVPRGDELRHYLTHGWREGRSISPFIATDYFRQANPSWVALGVSPLQFLCEKLQNGEHISTGLLDTRVLPSSAGEDPISRLVTFVTDGLGLPTTKECDFSDVDPLANALHTSPEFWDGPNDWVRHMSIVIPLYADHPITRAMLSRFEHISSNPDLDLILVLDGTEDSNFAHFIRTLSGPTVKVIEHAQSIGFSASVNEGISASRDDRHVLILNSDVLARLQVFTLLLEALESDPLLASVTAITNFGSIASYPTPGREGRWLPSNPDRLSQMFETDIFQDKVTQSPTGVGHCILIRRLALRQTGGFDAKRFPEGYGEEVDWSIRATKLGWRHGIANKAFVWHQGSTSFGARKHQLRDRGNRLLQQEYGADYEKLLEDARNTSKDLLHRYQVLDAHLIAATAGPESVILTHTMGGGTYEFIDRQSDRTGDAVYVFLDRENQKFRVSTNGQFLPALELHPAPLNNLSCILDSLAAQVIEVHTGLASDTRNFLIQVSQTNAKKRYYLHDYAPFCARINLIGGSSEVPALCGAPVDDRTCQACVSRHGSLVGTSDVAELRAAARLAFAGADRITIPHASGLGIWRKWGVKARAARHNKNRDDWGTGKTQSRLNSSSLLDGRASTRRALLPSHKEGRPRILVPGRISYAKGATVIRDTLRLNRVYGSPIEFLLCGEVDPTYFPELGLFSGVIGDYDHRLPSLVKSLHIDGVWFSSIWPETYMYTLDDITDLPMSTVVFLNSDIGAPLERAAELGLKKTKVVQPEATKILREMVLSLVS